MDILIYLINIYIITNSKNDKKSHTTVAYIELIIFIKSSI